MKNTDIEKRLEQNRIPFDKELPEKLEIYLALLQEWNSRMDLTAVTDDEETIDKHFVDSLIVMKTDLIALTHYHGDHIFGLPGLLQNLGVQGRTEPLFIPCDDLTWL